MFSRDEVRQALALLAPPEMIPSILAELYDQPGSTGTTFFFGELLDALSVLSDSAAQRVRQLLNEDEAQARVRIAAFREKHPGN